MDKGYEKFIKALIAEVGKQLGKDYTVFRQDTVKNNGVICRCICISKHGHAVSPCYRTDTYYELYRGLEDVRVIASDIVKSYRVQGYGTQTADTDWFTDWERIRGHILFRLVNTERNVKALEGLPHLDVPELGLSMVCHIALREGTEIVSLERNHMRLWNVTEDEVMEQALKNTPEQNHAWIRSMSEVLGSVYGCGEGPDPQVFEQLPLYVLTNEQQVYGAACMLYEGLLERTAEQFGADLYIFPSSVHEVLLHPVSGKIQGSVEDMRNMVREINASELLEEEVLSDEVYYYDREKKVLLTAE